MDYGHTAAQFLAFSRFPKADAWFNAGPTTSYPDTNDGARIAERRPCPARRVAGCKVFNVSRVNNTATEVEIDDGLPMGNGDVDQVMVFQYKGKFVAVNHVGFLPRHSEGSTITGLTTRRNARTRRTRCQMASDSTSRILESR